ncbi:MAG: hypothetical protein K6B17_02640 [Treponema sp.]|nr:hypothetical protein [Treponema sp.]
MIRNLFKTFIVFSAVFAFVSCSNFFSDFTNDDGSQKTGRDEVTYSSSADTIVYPDSGVISGELYNTVTDKGFVIIKNTLPNYNLIDFDDTRNDYIIGEDTVDFPNPTADSKVNLGIADNPVNFKCFPDDKNATIKWYITQTAIAHLNGTTDTIDEANQTEKELDYSGTDRDFLTKIPYGTCIVKAVVYADDPMYNTTYTFKINKPVSSDFTEVVWIDLTKKNDGSNEDRVLTTAEFSPDSDYNKYTITQALLGELPDYIRLKEAVYYPNRGEDEEHIKPLTDYETNPDLIKIQISDPVGKSIVLSQGISTLAITYEDTTDGFTITKQINFKKHKVGDTKLMNQSFSDPSEILHIFSGVYANGSTVEEGKYLRGLKTDVAKYSDIEFSGHDTPGTTLSGVQNDGDYFELYARADREIYFRTDSNSSASQTGNFIFECKPDNEYAYISLCNESENYLALPGELTYGGSYYGLRTDNVPENFTIRLHDVTDVEEDVRIENIRIKTHPYAHYETSTDTELRSDIAYHRVAIRTPGEGNKQLLAYKFYNEGSTEVKITQNAEWDSTSNSWHLNTDDADDVALSDSNYKKYTMISVFAVNKANDEKIKVSAEWKEDASGNAKNIPLSVEKKSNGEFYIMGYKGETHETITYDDRNEYMLPPGKIDVFFYLDADGDDVCDTDEDKKTVHVTNTPNNVTTYEDFSSTDGTGVIGATGTATAENSGKTYYIIPDAPFVELKVKMKNSWQVPEFYATDTNGTLVAGEYPNLCRTPEHVEGSRIWTVQVGKTQAGENALPGTKDIKMTVTANNGTTKSAETTIASVMQNSTYINNDISTAPVIPAEGNDSYKEFTFEAKPYQSVEVSLNDGNPAKLEVEHDSDYKEYTIKLGNSDATADDAIPLGNTTINVKITSLSGVSKTYTYNYYSTADRYLAQAPQLAGGTSLSTNPEEPTELPDTDWETSFTLITEDSTYEVTGSAVSENQPTKHITVNPVETSEGEWTVTVGDDGILSAWNGLPKGNTTVTITVKTSEGDVVKTYTYYINNPNS